MNFKSRDKKSFNVATEPILIHRKDTTDGQSYSGNMLNFMENWSFNKLSKFNKLNKFTTSLINPSHSWKYFSRQSTNYSNLPINNHINLFNVQK